MVALQYQNTVPRLSDAIINRPRLLEKLQFITQYKLTLIIAPPGYGKTILATQFAQRSTTDIAWHTVVERERDFQNLHKHCVSTLAKIIPSIAEFDTKPDSAPSEMASLLTDHLHQSLSKEFIYIFDDAHLLDTPGSEIWLRYFVAQLPSNGHVILLSRVLPNLPLAEMAAHQEILTIGQEQLGFTAEETETFAQQLGADLSDPEIQTVIARVGGWPAGITLALHPLRHDVEQVVFANASGSETLFNFLAESMLQAQPLPFQNFLLASSTFVLFTPDLCHQALHLPGSYEYTIDILNRNLFLAEVPGGLQYHSLFREFLQTRFQAIQPEQFQKFHIQAAQWFENNNQLEEAFYHYLTAPQATMAAAIAQRVAQAYFSQGKVETLLDWNRQLLHLGLRIPMLLYTCAMIHTNRYEYDLAITDLEATANGFQTNRDETGQLKVQLLQAHIYNQTGQYKKAIQQATLIANTQTTPDNLQGYALTILGIAHFHLGNIQTALDQLMTALPLYRSVGDHYAIAQLLAQLEVVYLRLGRFEQAAACLQETVAIHRSLKSAAGLAMALNNLGYHYQLLGNYQQAYLTLEEGLTIANRASERRVESYLLWSMGDVQRDRSYFGEASHLYQKALLQISKGEPALRSSILTSLAILHRWQGNWGESRTLADEALHLADRHHLTLEKIKAEMASWAARMYQEDAEIALKALHTLAEELYRHEDNIRLTQAWGLCAIAALLSDNNHRARDYLKQILHTVAHEANLQPFVAEIVHCPILRKLVMRHYPYQTTLIEGIKKLEAVQFTDNLHKPLTLITTTRPTYSLRVWCLGQEHLERDSKTVSANDWQATTAKELFFYLLFKGATTREMISLIFWPDSSSAQVRATFHTSLYRARQALGNNVLLFEDGLYFINPAVQLWCDALELDKLVQQARPLAPRTAHAENLWERAVKLYKGEFLPSLNMDWIDGSRAKFQETYIEALQGLATTARARGDFQKALATCKKILEIDPYREDIHCAMILYYLEQGQRQLARQQYQDLLRLLHQDLGVDPSPETLILAHQLLD